MVGWKFSAANLEDSFFLQSDMRNSHFYLTILKDATFNKVNLEGCAFDSSNLLNTKFKNCNLINTSFDNAVVDDRDWFETLEKNENTNVTELREKYKLEDYFEFDDDHDFCKPEWYKILLK